LEPKIKFSGSIVESTEETLVLRYSLDIERIVRSEIDAPVPQMERLAGGISSNARISLGHPVDILSLGPETYRLVITRAE
jgi:hypothetical protein